jgi:hypothetical protein
VDRTAYPIETVVPGWRSDKRSSWHRHCRRCPSGLLAGPAALQPQRDYKTLTLWGPLDGGVLLGWMAWR